jgi:hypothetical protein
LPGRVTDSDCDAVIGGEVSDVCPKSVDVVTVGEENALWLARIVMDDDRDEALKFVKTVVHRQIEGHKNGLLQSHLDTNSNPTVAFDKRRGAS